MVVKIRSYQSKDFQEVVKLMENLQDYLVEKDQLKRLRRLEEYGKSYTSNLVKEIRKNKGMIYLAEENGKILGCIAGTIKKQTKEQRYECVYSKVGTILELVIYPEFRSKGIGKVLMNKIEDYFKKEECTTITLEVMQGNKDAYEFYKRLEYQERSKGMIKIIKWK